MFFHSSSCGPDENAFKKILIYATKYAKNNNINQLVIAVHAKNNLDGVITKVLGKNTVKNIMDNSLEFDGVNIGLMTERIDIPVNGDVVILAVHTSTKFLKKLELNRQQKALFYLPWLQEELEAFIKRNTSTQIEELQ